MDVGGPEGCGLSAWRDSIQSLTETAAPQGLAFDRELRAFVSVDHQQRVGTLNSRPVFDFYTAVDQSVRSSPQVKKGRDSCNLSAVAHVVVTCPDRLSCTTAGPTNTISGIGDKRLVTLGALVKPFCKADFNHNNQAHTAF